MDGGSRRFKLQTTADTFEENEMQTKVVKDNDNDEGTTMYSAVWYERVTRRKVASGESRCVLVAASRRTMYLSRSGSCQVDAGGRDA